MVSWFLRGYEGASSLYLTTAYPNLLLPRRVLPLTTYPTAQHRTITTYDGGSVFFVEVEVDPVPSLVSLIVLSV